MCVHEREREREREREIEREKERERERERERKKEGCRAGRGGGFNCVLLAIENKNLLRLGWS